MYKVGIGYDVHSLEIGNPFILGGIKSVSYTHLRAHET